jgi:Small subunit of phenylpropionate dioxygenase
MSNSLDRRVESLLYRETKLLDEGKYEQWLQLYSRDCIYWIPTWVSDYSTTMDPRTQVSYIYLDRKGLESYVRRLASGEAPTYEPPPKTVRLVSNVLVDGVDGETIRASANWIMLVSRTKGIQTLGGSSEYRLKPQDGELKIAYKKAIVATMEIQGGQLLLV